MYAPSFNSSRQAADDYTSLIKTLTQQSQQQLQSAPTQQQMDQPLASPKNRVRPKPVTTNFDEPQSFSVISPGGLLQAAAGSASQLQSQGISPQGSTPSRRGFQNRPLPSRVQTDDFAGDDDSTPKNRRTPRAGTPKASISCANQPQLPQGFSLRLWNTEDHRYDSFFSERASYTRGGGQYIDTLRSQNKHLVYKEQCWRYKATGDCPFGSECWFIHVVGLPNQIIPALLVMTPEGDVVHFPVDLVYSTEAVTRYDHESNVILHMCEAFPNCALGPKCSKIHTPCDSNTLALFHLARSSVASPKSVLCRLVRRQSPLASTCTCDAAHSIEELIPTPNALEKLEGGKLIEVFDEEANMVAIVPSEQVYNTAGVDMYLKAHSTGRILGREICKQFRKYRKCEWWEKCKFVHLVNGYPDISCTMTCSPTRGSNPPTPSNKAQKDINGKRSAGGTPVGTPKGSQRPIHQGFPMNPPTPQRALLEQLSNLLLLAGEAKNE